jgi:hypothetical protein
MSTSSDSKDGAADTIEYHGGTVAETHELVPSETDDGTKLSLAERKAIARNRTLAIALIRGANPTRYGTLLANLSNQYAMGNDDYLTDITSAYSLLVNYKTPTNAQIRTTNAVPNHQASDVPEASAMTFTQRGNVVGTDGKQRT